MSLIQKVIAQSDYEKINLKKIPKAQIKYLFSDLNINPLFSRDLLIFYIFF